MKPWQVSVGITLAVSGVATILLVDELSYLPFHLLLDNWVPIAFHGGMAIGCLAAGLYAAARAIGLAGVGRQTDLTERALRRGQGDPALAQALKRETEGKFR